MGHRTQPVHTSNYVIGDEQMEILQGSYDKFPPEEQEKITEMGKELARMIEEELSETGE